MSLKALAAVASSAVHTLKSKLLAVKAKRRLKRSKERGT